MHGYPAAIAMVVGLLCFPACAENLPAVSVRAFKRLVFADEFARIPGGLTSMSFLFLRSGDTNQSLAVDFELSGTATPGSDYGRILPGGLVATGALQNVVFAPGERVTRADFYLSRDDTAEEPEFIRLRIVPPIRNGFAPPTYRNGARACATVWMLERHCRRAVPTPGGGQACLEFEPFRLPLAFFATARCGNLTVPPPERVQ